ncbi:MAG: efflux RND transporter permease subunit, partial [Thiogranum sp.]
MLSRLIDQGVENRLLVVLALLATVVGATLTVPSLNLDAFPDVTNVQVVVNTEAPGLAAEEVEQLITYPIEAVMYALPDVEEVRSISKTGLSVITVVFEEGTDIYFARQLVFERLQAAREQVPEGVGVPELGPNTSGLGQVFQYVLKTSDAEQYDAMRLRSLNDWVVKLLLMPVEGITDVLSFGGDVLQYQVQIDPSQLLAYALTLNEVVEAIEANNRNAGGWYLDRGAEQLVVRGVGWVRSGAEGLRDIGNIPVKDVDGVAVRVRDLARVDFGAEIRQGAVTLTARDSNGNPQHAGEVVTGIVLKRLGANTKSTIDAVKERLPIIQQALPEGVSLEPIYDQADLVAKAVATVTRALVEAFVLILLVLFLFLVNLRATLLVLISIPVSIGLALMAMAHWGISANLMSLGGLAIAIGMMVDGSVVMMENIFKHLNDDEHQRGGELRVQEAAREVGRPVFFAVLIIIVVFTPLFTLEGVEGKLFQPMALAIMFAMLASLLVALVVIPALASYLFRHGVHHRESPLMKPLSGLYRKGLMAAIEHRKTVVGSAMALLIAILALLPRLGSEFVPELEEGSLMIRVTLAPSSSLQTALVLAPKLEAQLLRFPEVLYASSRIGRAELGGD